jgi:hypothetical protein
MARKKRIKHSKCDVKRALVMQGVDFKKDVHELSHSDLNAVAMMARATGYRKSKTAPGSTGRMYFELLQRQRGC